MTLTMSMFRNKDDMMEAIFQEAKEAAFLATEMAMIAEIAARGIFTDNRGACGFAWVTIDGKSPLAAWCRKQRKAVGSDRLVKPVLANRYGSKGYPSGWQFWNPSDYQGQRVDIKEVGARAFRDKLAEYGYSATVGSRLD